MNYSLSVKQTLTVGVAPKHIHKLLCDIFIKYSVNEISN